jgi:hypothetical protein
MVGVTLDGAPDFIERAAAFGERTKFYHTKIMNIMLQDSNTKKEEDSNAKKEEDLQRRRRI